MRPAAIYQRWPAGAPALLGGMCGAVLCGPAWGARSLAMLDLVVGPRIQVPAGVWGLGPELPRRGMFVVPLAWASSAVPGPLLVAALVTLAVSGACAGVHRLTLGAPEACRLGAGLLYACSPYVLTRIGIGHLGLVLAAGLLPWAVPTLAGPSRDPGRTFVWLLAFAGCGFSGALVAVLLATCGWLTEERRSPLGMLAIASPQALWLVPGAIVAAQMGQSPEASASSFATTAPGVEGVAAVLAGGGFWTPVEQAGPPQLSMAIAGLVLGALALAGRQRVPPPWRRAATLGAIAALTITLASAMPVAADLFDRLTATGLGAPLREGQRFIVLFLLWASVAGAHGIEALAGGTTSLARRSAKVVLPSLAIALALPSVWGLGGRLRPAGLEPGWSEAQMLISAQPGPIAALPFSQYVVLPGSGRRVVHPASQYLDGDVIESTDPGFDVDAREEADPRADALGAILLRRADGHLADALADLGIRWLAVVPGMDEDLARSLGSRPGLRTVLSGDQLMLVRNERWVGPALDEAGNRVDVDPVVAPLASTPSGGPLRWLRAGASAGWLRGTKAAELAPNGTLLLPGGEGPVWFWPTAVVAGTDILLITVALGTLRRRHRSRAERACPVGTAE